MFKFYFRFVILTIFAIVANGYKIPREAVPVPAIKNAALEYKGPVFLIKETDDVNEPFIGLIVDGGIEMVRPYPKPHPVPYANLPSGNESVPEIQEDPEYFAVVVTPDTVAQAQISRTTTITIPLTVLLTGVSTKIPWLMVLKKQNHFDYFKTLMTNPKPITIPQRRRYKRDTVLERGRLFSGDKNYDMLYTEDDKTNVSSICTTLVRELMILNELSQRNDNNIQDAYELDPLKIDTKDETKVNKDIREEYVVGTEYKVGQKST